MQFYFQLNQTALITINNTYQLPPEFPNCSVIPTPLLFVCDGVVLDPNLKIVSNSSNFTYKKVKFVDFQVNNFCFSKYDLQSYNESHFYLTLKNRNCLLSVNCKLNCKSQIMFNNVQQQQIFERSGDGNDDQKFDFVPDESDVVKKIEQEAQIMNKTIEEKQEQVDYLTIRNKYYEQQIENLNNKIQIEINQPPVVQIQEKIVYRDKIVYKCEAQNADLQNTSQQNQPQPNNKDQFITISIKINQILIITSFTIIIAYYAFLLLISIYRFGL